MDYIPRNEEEFLRKYTDTHTELQMIEQMTKKGNKGSVISKHPSDYNVKNNKYEVAKKKIEKKAMTERADDYRNFVLDATSVRAKDILTMNAKDLFYLAAKVLPQQLESKVENTFTFAEFAKNSYENANAETIDVEVEDPDEEKD